MRNYQGNQKPTSIEILMFVCLQNDAKQCGDAKMLDLTHSGCQPEQLVQSNFQTSQQRLRSIQRQTNIKIYNLRRPILNL